jgi:chitinase
VINIIKNSISRRVQRIACIFSMFVVCVFSINLWASSVAAETKVIGYIASFTDMKGAIDKTDLSKLTHINLSFTNPNAQGKLVDNGVMTCMPGNVSGNVSAADVRYVIDKAHAAGVKVLASVAGGVIPACSGNWETLLQPANRQLLVDNLIVFMEEFDLDGIDVDIEGVLLTNIDNAGNYTPFIQALSAQLLARNKLLTCATASYVGGMIPISSIPYFDFVNIMAYDAIGPSWGHAGAQHSTYAMAVEHVNLWKNRGLTKEQLVLGVPFYGYGFGSYKSDYTYASILTEFGADAATKDLIGSACAGCNYITYNGAATIKAKTKLGLEQGSGIMIWELSQDAAGANSLLKVIDDELNNSSVSSSAASSVTASADASSMATSSLVSVTSSLSDSASSITASLANNSSAKSSSGGSGALSLAMMLMLFSLIFAPKISFSMRKNKNF